MGFLGSLFSGRQHGDTDELENRQERVTADVSNGMSLTVLLSDGKPLLTGRVAEFTAATVTLERLPGGLSFHTCEVGERVLVRGCNRKMMQFGLEGTVSESSRTSCKLEKLKKESFSEHRNNFRLAVNFPVTLYYQDDVHGQNPERCTLIDISTGGACIQSEFLHAEGEVLRLKAKLDDYAPMEFIGEVIRVVETMPGQFQYGFLFAQLTEEETEALTRTLYNIQTGDRREHGRNEYGSW